MILENRKAVQLFLIIVDLDFLLILTSVPCNTWP